MDDDWDWTKPKELTIENLEEAVRLMRDMSARDDIIACDKEMRGVECGFIVQSGMLTCRQCGFPPKDRVIRLGEQLVICNKCGVALRSEM